MACVFFTQLLSGDKKRDKILRKRYILFYPRGHHGHNVPRRAHSVPDVGGAEGERERAGGSSTASRMGTDMERSRRLGRDRKRKQRSLEQMLATPETVLTFDLRTNLTGLSQTPAMSVHHVGVAVVERIVTERCTCDRQVLGKVEG